ncbi:DMT family transporter [Patescibacteria group bacterium]|nr:DMT family transporter [Patescibacteria group bacterium]
MNWIIIAIISHFLTAIVFIIDKFIVSKTAIRPVIYSFYVGILGGLTILLFPFGFELISLKQIIISFMAGILFIFATLYFYKTIKISEISRIIPIIGGAVAVFTLILTYLFLEERLSSNQFIAFFLLVFGGLIILWPKRNKKMFSFQKISFILLSALFFAGSYVLTKMVFTEQSFINGFIWIRLGSVLGACLLLILPRNRKIIFNISKEIKKKTIILPIFSKSLSAFAFFLLNYAIFLGNVALVNALQGVQYVFLLIMAFFLSAKFPQIIKEQINRGVIFKRILGIIFVCLGLIFLTL